MSTSTAGFEYDHDFSVPVCRLFVITSHSSSHTSLIPLASFSTRKQHEGARAPETGHWFKIRKSYPYPISSDTWSDVKVPTVMFQGAMWNRITMA